MNHSAWPTQSRLSRAARRQRSTFRYLMGSLLVTALGLAGFVLLGSHAQDQSPSTALMGQAMSYRQVPALLAQAQRHNPLLRLPHAHWFIRVRHGDDQLVIVDRAPLQGSGGTLDAAGKGQ